MKVKIIILFLLIGAISIWTSSCKHDSFIMDDDMLPMDTIPVDTTMTDTTMVDTTMNGVPCDPDLVYFELEILPLLNSNCAFSGCHDAASAEDGVILESYETVMATADVEPYNLNDSEIYEVLVDDDIDDRMPPSPTAPLTSDQIQLIGTWILQGAENLECDPSLEGCDTEEVSFAETVMPIIDLTCAGCHSGNVPSGGIDLTTYDGVKEVAENGNLVGAISWDSNFSNMPQGGDQLSDCIIDQIKSWVDAGALNN